MRWIAQRNFKLRNRCAAYAAKFYRENPIPWIRSGWRQGRQGRQGQQGRRRLVPEVSVVPVVPSPRRQAPAQILVAACLQLLQPWRRAGLGAQEVGGVLAQEEEVGVLRPLPGLQVETAQGVDGRHGGLRPVFAGELPHAEP